jgi:hypothetical protein
MRQCLGCQGLVPAPLDHCPNCVVTARGHGLSKALTVAGVIAVVGTSCLAMPVYGAPCISKQVDGGTAGCGGECTTLEADGGDPSKDPARTDCFVKPDGGP